MNKKTRVEIAISIILLLFGVVLLFESELTILTVSYVIGALLIAAGVMAIIRFIKNISSPNYSLDVVYGVVTTIMGLLAIKHPEVIGSIVPIIIGGVMILNSAFKLQYSLELKKLNYSNWLATAILSIASLLCGVVLIFNPFKSAVIIMQIIGGFIIVYAILNIVATIMLKNNKTDDGIKEAEVIEEKTSATKKKGNKNEDK